MLQLISMIVLGLSSPSFQTNDLLVSSPSGVFKGTQLTAPSGLSFVAFRGIPYALPPVGELRFGKPRPHPKLENVYDATKEAPICLQPSGVDIGSPGQEDCLYLNIFRPVRLFEKTNQGLKKVLVYIHGGAFFMGSGNEYVPGDFVAQGDVIVVTLNYRLSWLGFLKGNTPQLPGNQGYWDQLMALQWVKDNIQSFGGDSDDITLAGQSMGGESVSVWSIVNQSRNLFTKGIVMSGTIFTCPSTQGSSDILLDLLVDRVGCRPMNQDAKTLSKEWSEEEVSSVITCLQSLPSETFQLPPEGSLTNKFTSIDGELFPASFSELVTDVKYLSDVGFFSKSFLVSLTNNEGAPLTNGIFAAEGADETEKEFLSKKVRVPLPVIEKAYESYSQPEVSSINKVHDIWSDPILAVPTFDFLRIHTSKFKGMTPEDAAGKSYFLYFDIFPSFLPAPHEGTFHSFDLTYLFDLQPSYVLKSFYSLETNETFTAEDVQLKSSLIKIVTDFMASGNPGVTLAENLNMEWPPYEEESEFYLNFKPDFAVAQFPIKARRDIWTDLFPKWMKEFSESSQRKTEL
ncbi:cholinesterase isoform X2 [Aplysia californica]|nr:cholinesterase isoform X2 [Aplysia californica]XP_005098654.1 cholinesterase isoform X2 [Aplysia californica]XP_005098656.1 cholinesterase isoform X2 [Aplysia californica]